MNYEVKALDLQYSFIGVFSAIAVPLRATYL